MSGSTGSPPAFATPASQGMIRKRTLQDAQPSSPHMQLAQSPASSSSPVAYGFNFDSSPRNNGLLSSPASIYSSPMSRSASAQSVFSPFSQTLHTSPLAKVGAAGAESASSVRPNMKRRRTFAEGASPGELPCSPVKAESVSPVMAAPLRLLPRLGRKKLIIDGKACGRNELIGGYIKRVTGKERTRKQVSSHIQVLKSNMKDNQAFMDLVSEPDEGDDRFEGNNAALFFGPSSRYARLEAFAPSPQVLVTPKIDITAAHNLPPLPSQGSSDLALSSPFVIHPAHGVATPTTQLANAFQDMSVMPPPLPPSCPFVPANLCMWAAPDASGTRQQGHIFARLGSESVPSGHVLLEDLPNSARRYPMLASMIDHQPCNFMHVKLRMYIPTTGGSAGLEPELNAQLRLLALQRLDLYVLTSIHCHGDQIIQFLEPLAEPAPIDDGSHGSSASSSSRTTSPIGRSFRHKYAYEVPFAAAYWTHYLGSPDAAQRSSSTSPSRRSSSGGPASPFARSGKARFDLANTLSMCSVLQEFIVVRDESAPLPTPEHGVSLRGSDIGDAVLVVAYDLEVCETAHRGSAELSYLTTRTSVADAPRHEVVLSYPSPTLAPPAAPPMLRSATSPAHIAFGAGHEPQQGSMLPPPPRRAISRLPSASRVPLQEAHKPNLSLHIPPPDQFVRRGSASSLAPLGPTPSPGGRFLNGPVTPWGQIAHTPNAPPPVLPPGAEDAAQRERLEHIWLQQASNEWEQHSPALMGLSSAPSSTIPMDALPIPPAQDPYAADLTALAPSPVDLDGIFDVCIVPSAYEPAGAPAASQALNALTASAAALPTPTFASFPVPSHDAGLALDMYHVPPFATDSSLTASAGMPAGGLVPMSVSSSSNGSTASSASLQTPLEQVPSRPQQRSGGDPVKGRKMSLSRKAEQDYFSSLLGATTKYS
ncbi:hypothetical protein Rhopal_001405-T1 [Rhodotorula paludigena]|uniref:TEA domain-containing protein n=1 Tax=Rhodotorula paludigena TaxID=86838 RepID=A0AAV5GEX4_9BASI|nr:hypothetical protein Rhopal_001405-T1 [Rhodotorula paludigena]